MEDHPDVAEAIKRLPIEEQDLRLFRLKRASDLTMKQIILPEDQWTKPEEVQYWQRIYDNECMRNQVRGRQKLK